MKLSLPLFVDLPRKKGNKRFYLGLNPYRNTHFQILNHAKELYKHQVLLATMEIKEKLPPPPYLFEYTIYPGTGRKFDLANVLPIVQKFTDDALIHFGIIFDDSYKVIHAINYRFGGVDKDNPRAELSISSY